MTDVLKTFTAASAWSATYKPKLEALLATGEDPTLRDALIQEMLNRLEYTKDVSAAAASDATAALALLGDGDVALTPDGGIARKMVNCTGAASVAGSVVVADMTPVEAGDAAGQLSAWSFVGPDLVNTDAGVIYWSLTVPDTVTYYWTGVTDAAVVYHYEGVTDAPVVYYYEGITDAPTVYYWGVEVDAPVRLYWAATKPAGNATISVYSDLAMTVKVCEGALVGDGGGAIVLAEVGGSGISGTVTVTAVLVADDGYLDILDDVITEQGDSLAQCSGWTIVGEAQTLSTVTVWDTAAHTTVLCQGTVDHDTGGAVVLAEVGGSGISGTVTLVADAIEDVDATNTLSILDDVVTEAGDSAAQASAWTIVGEPQTLYTVDVYSDAAKTVLVAQGTVDHSAGGAGVVLAAVGGSGITGTVDVAASAADSTAANNTLSVLDDVVTEGGDAGGAFSNWTLAGYPATMYTVTVYDDILHTTTLCQGTVDHVAGGAGVVLAEVGGSGITGTVDVSAAAADSIVDGNTLSITDDAIVEAGDAGGDFAGWTIVGEPQTLYTVSVYADAAHTVLLCHGTVDHDTGGAVVLASDSAAAVSGTVDVIANAVDDTDAANELVITAGVIVEADDAAAQFSNWTIAGEAQSLVTCYSDSAKTVPTAAGQIDNTTGGTITLAAVGGSGLTGSVTVIPLAVEDVDAANTVTLGTTNGVDLCGTNGTGVVGVIYNAGVADGSPVWVTFAGTAQVLIEPLSDIMRGGWVRTGSTTAGYAECEAVYDAAQAQQQIGYSLGRKKAGVGTTCAVHLTLR